MAQRLRNVHRQTESDVANILFILSHSMDFAAKTKTPRTPYQMSQIDNRDDEARHPRVH